MTDMVYMALKRVLKDRTPPKTEMVVDGCSGFLFLDKDGRPKVAMHLENYMRLLQRKHRWALGEDFPVVTPHVLRHTFCTNLQRAGIDIKSLQYLMGHSSASVTLDVYTTRTTTPSSTPLIRSQPTCDRIKTGHFPYTASYTICVETYPYLCRFTESRTSDAHPKIPQNPCGRRDTEACYTSAWAASKSPGRAGGMYEAQREPQAPRPSAVGLFFFSVLCFFFSR